jgi:UrcA family protein
MKAKHKNAIGTVIAAALLAAFATGVQAEDVAQVHVKYADLNVNNPAGAAVLYQRIRAAAEKVCAMPGSRELDRAAQAKACMTKATADAVAAVNAPALTGLYEAKAAGNTRLASIR